MRVPVRSLPAAPRRAASAAPRRTPRQLRVAPAEAIDAGWIYPRPAAPAEPRWRDQAVAAVSHDLRNPLNSISLAAELLERTFTADPALEGERRLLESIVISTEKMRRMVMDLLDQSVLEGGTLPVSPTETALGDILHDAARTHALEAAQRGVALEVLDAAGATVLADADRIDQVLGNLMGNALAHTPHGGRVTVTAERADAQVRVSVADTGRGIQPDDLARIFDRNWRGAETRTHGAGLGLSIAQAIVRAHGGEIRAESTPGQGTTITFTLPLA